MQDCRVMIDIDARNAIIAMVKHLLSAFKLPARPRQPLQPPGARGPAAAQQLLELPSKLRPPSGQGCARKRAALQSLAPSASIEAGGTLLRTLLQQQKVCILLHTIFCDIYNHIQGLHYHFHVASRFHLMGMSLRAPSPMHIS